jgi:hypothetical protein
MILAPLTVAALMLNVATTPDVTPNRQSELSVAQKNAATQKFVRSATDCLAQTVAADPRFRAQADIGDLIVDSMPACLGPVRAMIDVYDQYFGNSAGFLTSNRYIGWILRPSARTVPLPNSLS